MYVVTKYGKKLKVDDSSIDYENEFSPAFSNVCLFSDETFLRPIWIATVQKLKRHDSYMHSMSEPELFEFTKEQIYDHKPTEEELLYLMSAWGCGRYDIVTVDEGYELDEHYND